MRAGWVVEFCAILYLETDCFYFIFPFSFLRRYEDPNDSALSVEGQVRLLISEATSDENLHKIFAGWAPWV